MKLASFDIFDTALIRKCGRPENIFFLLSHRLYPHDQGKRADFLLWRNAAGRRAHDKFPGRQITLGDIYNDEWLSGFSEFTPSLMMACEKEVESENLMVNPYVRGMIDLHRGRGFQVCFISDMYLDSEFLESLLRREGCLAPGERVYVSCECDARKSNGLLFETLKKQLNPSEWVHYGDNLNSDYKMALRHGIKAVRVDTSFTAAEQKIIDAETVTRYGSQLSVMTGISRAARITLGNDAFAAMASDHVAPAYIPYALFVAGLARERNIKRLYFLSRDNYIIMKSVEELAPADIELKYFFVSRRSLLLPYLTDTSAESYLAVMDHGSVYSRNVDALLSHLGTDRDELAGYGIGFKYEKIGDCAQEQDFLNKIFVSDFTPVLHERAIRANKTALEYFRQEGLLDCERAAIVDVGWLGTSRLMINSILRNAGYGDVEFYYYGVRGDVMPVKYGYYISYFAPGQLTTEATCLIEDYFSASPYPTTTGYYRDENGWIKPRFHEGEHYCETEITRANIDAIKWMTARIVALDFNSDACYAWAKLSTDTVINLDVPVDISPFSECKQTDMGPFISRLSLWDAVKIVCLGDHVTAFDKASLLLTFGHRLLPALWSMHRKTGALRRRVYLKVSKTRSGNDVFNNIYMLVARLTQSKSWR